MKKLFLLGYALLALGVGRVAAQSVSYSLDKSADFYKYKTYKWVSIQNAQQLDELTSDQLIGTVDAELAKKGLTKMQSDNADLYIGYQIGSGKEKQLRNYNIGASYGSPAGGNMGTAGATTTIVHSGQLALDMYDAAKKQLVWRGVVSNSIEADAKPDKKQKHMSKAIEKLLKGYPPQKKS